MSVRFTAAGRRALVAQRRAAAIARRATMTDDEIRAVLEPTGALLEDGRVALLGADGMLFVPFAQFAVEYRAGDRLLNP